MKQKSPYDRIARAYGSLEWLLFGKQLQRIREKSVQSIAATTSPSNILLVGGGTGRSLIRLIEAFPDASITSVDMSSKMLEVQKRRAFTECPRANAPTWIHQDWRELESEFQFDFIYFPFVLDCLREDEIGHAIDATRRLLADDGNIVWVDFVPLGPMTRSFKNRFRMTLMHQFFGWLTDHPNRKPVDLSKRFAQQGCRDMRTIVGVDGMAQATMTTI